MFLVLMPMHYARLGNRKRGMGRIGMGRISLFHQVETVPVSPEVLDLTRRQLEAGAELAVLEEDVCVPEAGRVEVLPLPLLGQDAFDALDEPDLLEDADLAVACGDWDAVFVADFLDAALWLLGREENLVTVLVGQKLGGVEWRKHLRGSLECDFFRSSVP